jgi:hypothetical protein
LGFEDRGWVKCYGHSNVNAAPPSIKESAFGFYHFV